MKMNKILYLLIFVLFFTVACNSSNDDEKNNIANNDTVLEFKDEELIIEEDETLILEINYSSNVDINLIIWNSSNDKIVSVNNGEITGIKAGTAIISMSYEENKYIDSIEITVISGNNKVEKPQNNEELINSFYDAVSELEYLTLSLDEDIDVNDNSVVTSKEKIELINNILENINDNELKDKLNLFFSNVYIVFINKILKKYSNNIDNELVIDENIGSEIMNYKFGVTSIFNGNYYGEFNESYVVQFNESTYDVCASEYVAGILFSYNVPNYIKVYNNGALYSLNEAYNNGLLKYEDIIIINAYHRYYYSFMYNNYVINTIYVNLVDQKCSYNYYTTTYNVDEEDIKNFIASTKHYLNKDFEMNLYLNNELTIPYDKKEVLNKIHVYGKEEKEYYTLNDLGIKKSDIKECFIKGYNTNSFSSFDLKNIQSLLNGFDVVYFEEEVDEFKPQIGNLQVNNFIEPLIELKLKDNSVIVIVISDDGYIGVLANNKTYKSKIVNIDVDFLKTKEDINFNDINRIDYVVGNSKIIYIYNSSNTKLNSFINSLSNLYLKMENEDSCYNYIVKKNSAIFKYEISILTNSDNYYKVVRYYNGDYTKHYSYLVTYIDGKFDYYVLLDRTLDEATIYEFNDSCVNNVDYKLSDIIQIYQNTYSDETTTLPDELKTSFIIDSYNDYCNFISKYNFIGLNYKFEDLKQAYDEKFFENNSLILSYHKLIDSVYYCGLYKENSTLIIKYHNANELEKLNVDEDTYLEEDNKIAKLSGNIVSSELLNNDFIIIEPLPELKFGTILLDLPTFTIFEVEKSSLVDVEKVIAEKCE